MLSVRARPEAISASSSGGSPKPTGGGRRTRNYGATESGPRRVERAPEVGEDERGLAGDLAVAVAVDGVAAGAES
jgi:hypothetical protein